MFIGDVKKSTSLWMLYIYVIFYMLKMNLIFEQIFFKTELLRQKKVNIETFINIIVLL